MTSIACRTFRCSHLPSLEDDRIQDSKTPAPGQIEALDNALNPGHNLYDAITKSSFTNAQIDMLELQEECYSEAMPSGERKEELERQNSKWTKMKARMKQVGSKQSIGLGSEQKAELVQKVLEARAEVGTRKFLQVFRRLLENSGKVFPDVTITYRDLQVEADALVGTGAINSIGNSLKQLFSFLKPVQREHVYLISKTSGRIRPGRATLLLGPPGAGKSLFMKVVSGRVKSDKNMKISGDIRYNGQTLDKFNVLRTAAYVDQEDNHLPILTVLETFKFAFDCLTPELDPEASKKNAEDQLKAAKEALAYVKNHLGQGQEELEGVEVAVEGGAEAGGGGGAAHPDSAELEDVNLRGGSELPDGGLPKPCKAAEHAIDEKLLVVLETFVEICETNAKVQGRQDLKVHIWLAYLGLAVCKDTIVGNALLRGISGGQRRRVTSGEFLVGGSSVLFLDEISTGLDSATTFSVCQQLCESCRVLNYTSVISLLQPPPETVDLFDDIMLFANGHIIYHGPNSGILNFFKALGFDCPVRKDRASFLQEVTTAIGQNQYASEALRASKGLSRANECSPLTPQALDDLMVPAAEMERAFWETDIGKEYKGEPDSAAGETENKPGLITGSFAKSLSKQVPVVLARQIILTLRNKSTTFGRLVQCIVMGILTGLLYSSLDKNPQNSRSFLGVIFTMISFLAMGNSSQVAVILAGREVFFKQRDSYFFKSFTYVISMTVTQLPITFCEVFFYTIPVYFMTGLAMSAANYFTLYGIAFLTSCSLGAVFRTIAAFSPDMVIANSFLSVIILVLILTSGFAITPSSIPPWWIWIYWISPFSWAFRAGALNEFLSDDPSWSALSDPQVTHEACGGVCTVGQQVLVSFDMPLDRTWILWGFLYELFLFPLMSVLCSIGMQTMRKPQQEATVSGEKPEEAACAELKLSNASKASKAMKASGVGASQKDDAMPFQPLSLVWKDIHYFVPFPKSKDSPKDSPKELELLKGITGYALPGSLTALMGGSGAGKTTFMDVIAGRKTVGRITGDIRVNGRAKEQAAWARVCGYVEQMDIHVPYCTVHEALEFSANLRLDHGSVTHAQVSKYVKEVMSMVDLWPIANRTIGTPGGQGLSLEQRKRVTIGVELVSNPGVIFMDEPTSGLDAKAAATVIRAVRKIGSSGRTIMVTIHQPSIEIFEAFDQLLLLQRGGYTIYFGSIGHESADLIAYYRAYQGVQPVPIGYNPATWMLEITGGAPQTLIAAAPYNFADEWTTNPVSDIIARECDEIDAKCLKEDEGIHVTGAYARAFFGQLKELFVRVNIVYWRNPSYNLVRLLLSVLYAALFGSLYWQAGNLRAEAEANGGVISLTTVTNILGISYTACIFLGLGNLVTAIPVVSLGRSVFYRESAVSMYSTLPYAISAALIEVPYIAGQVILFVPLMYAMVGFDWGDGKFGYWIVMYICSMSCFTFFGQFLVYVTPNPMLAQIVAGSMNFFWNIFSGFSIPYNAMPVYLAWINRIAPTSWVIYGLVVAQLGGDNDAIVDSFGLLLPVPQFLETAFGYQFHFRWYCILIVGGFALAFMLLSAFALLKINYNIR